MDEKMLQSIKSLEEKLVDERASSEIRLGNLRTELPDMLAARFLDEITSKEVADFKSEMNEIEVFIQDIPFALEGLKSRRKAVEKEIAVVKRKKARHEAKIRFEELENKIRKSKTYDRNLDMDLRGTAARIQKSEAADALIKNWIFRIEKTPGFPEH